jgi:hypothetical protein
MGRGAANPNDARPVGLAGDATVIKAEGIVRDGTRTVEGPYLHNE